MTTPRKVFLIVPKAPNPEKLIYSDNEQEARENVGSMLFAKTTTSPEMPLLNNDPYLQDNIKITEVTVTILNYSQQSKTLQCTYNGKAYNLTKNKPELVKE